MTGEQRFFTRIKWFDKLCSIHLAGAVRLMAALGNDEVSAWEIAP
jgi:hypothetical protein